MLFPLTPTYTVSELTSYLRELFHSSPQLQDLWVQGEISNLSFPQSGHIYFSLKDEDASLRCVIWKFNRMRLKTTLQDGMKIEAHGNIDLYEKGGQYQLYIDDVRSMGEGALYIEFLRLKERLQQEGLFDQERKRQLPYLPQRIGIVTSPTGAALQDILRMLHKRYPLGEVILAPTSVQGDAAPAEIVTALSALQEAQTPPDVIIVSRGGGSLEDLWAFNDERVVRAIATSRIPVITGIGHETDFTLSDFASDLRAPTPTGAAVVATPDILDLKAELRVKVESLNHYLLTVVNTERGQLQDLFHRLKFTSPLWQIRNDSQRLDELAERLMQHTMHYLQLRQAQFAGNASRLSALNPLSILQRGFAVVRKSNGALVKSIEQAAIGEALQLQFTDGLLGTRVENKIAQQSVRKSEE